MDKLWGMQVFTRVVEAGSYSRAANTMNLSIATVSTCVRKLEAHLGVVLLQRDTRSMRLTEEGSHFYESCRQILVSVEEAEVFVRKGSDQLRGTLRIDMPIAIGHLMLGPRLHDFAKQHPSLQVVVRLTNSLDRLIQRGIDLAIRMDTVDDGDLVARWIFEDQHVLCASPTFLDLHGIPSDPASLNSDDCLGYVPTLDSQPLPWEFTRGSRRVEVRPSANICFNSSDALLRSARNNGGYVYILKTLAQGYLDRGELVQVLPNWKTTTQTFYAVFPQTKFIPYKVRALLDFLTNDVFVTRPNPESRLVPQISAKVSV